MLKKIMWYSAVTIASIVILISIAGFMISMFVTNSSGNKHIGKDVSAAPSINSNNKSAVNNNKYNILVMGDSLARGTGDENGKGFAGYFEDSWKSKTSKQVKVNNIAVNGDVSRGLLKIVRSDETGSLIQASNIIFISIGGNELTKFRASDVMATTAEIQQTESNYLNNLQNIFKIIRNKNSSCVIVFIGLYNPFGDNITEDKLKLLNDWNYQTQQLVSSDSNSIFIPTYDLFKYNTKRYLTIDNFHPNSQGYKAISERVIQSLKNY